jgi:7,8-dihydropterin-6-yl-methyl-4-(beta-D-ribofuranosyl)aminobenzene 5'-phosphate synthase
MNSVTILVDNNKSQHRFLSCEHGFSLYLKYNDLTILFDFGASDVLINNAQLLNIDLSTVDYLVSSHSHYDHIDGLRDAASLLKGKELFVGANFDLKKYGKIEGNDKIIEYLGANFDKHFLDKHNISKTKVAEKFKISDNIYVVSNFKTPNDSSSFHRFVIEKSDKLEFDYFTDEVCMVIEREIDLVLIVGCSHPGILNIIEKVNSLFDKKISIVIGGTHLSKENDEKIQSISSSLIKVGIKDYYFCHCSGKKITDKLKSMGQNGNSVGVGTTILL